MQSSGGHIRRVRAHAAIRDDERKLAGYMSGLFYLLGALTGALTAALPGVAHSHRAIMLVLAGLALVVGLRLSIVRDWDRLPGWVSHVSAAFSLTIVALAVASSGGATSPAWVFVLFPVFFVSYFYGHIVAVAYLAACVVVQALPILYDARGTHGAFVAQLVVAAPVFVSLGLVTNAGKRRMARLRSRAEMLAAEQSALRRVATAVVDGRAAEAIYDMVAVEMARLLQCAGSGIMRLRDADSLVVVGSYGQSPTGVYHPGTVVPVRAGTDLHRALLSGLPVRVDAHPLESPAAHLGYRASIVAPVRVGERMWGILAVASHEPSTFDRDDEQTLREFGDLLATAIASAEERERLAEQALSDALTGLANQRALHARLEAELARAARHESPLAVAMIDVDHFKEINDNAGHETGDEMLVRVAAALESFARAEDTLARVGGDEFAWVLPDTSREQALVAVERARRLIAAAPPDPYRITISAGICDTETTTDPTELIRLADSALYWSKAHGRNQSWVYDPAVVDELSEQERAERLERSQALDGLRALVRALEARDVSTREHSERVGVLAGRLAARLGWSRDRALLLSQAALLHDVGRVGRSESIVRVARPVSPATLGELRSAAVASARTVDGLLPSEQVAWIGGQFSAITDDGARVDSDAEGASIVAVANLWDLLTAVTPGLPVHALAECERLAGEWFSRRVVGALSALVEAGEVGAGGAGLGSAGDPVGADE